MANWSIKPGEVWASDETCSFGCFTEELVISFTAIGGSFQAERDLLKGIIERCAVADGLIHDGCRTHCAIQTKGDCQNFRLDGRPGRRGRITDQDQLWIFTFQDGLAIPSRDDERSRQLAVGDQLLQVCRGKEGIFIQANGLRIRQLIMQCLADPAIVLVDITDRQARIGRRC